MKTVLFRCDSSCIIGTGHIMRDLVLAKRYADEGAKVIFACRNLSGNINQKVLDKGYELEILEDDSLKHFQTVIDTHNPNLLIIDHYDFGYENEKALKIKYASLKIMVLDDTYEKHYCDILLNHNIYAKEQSYAGLVPPRCQLRCGARFTLLRDEFLIEKQKGRQNKGDFEYLNVFIAMGGTDHGNLNIKILEVLEKFSMIYPQVVTTTANRYLSKLQYYINNHSRFSLHINSKKIAKLMNEADFAIVTPSVTVNEVIYLNVPFIAIKTADNQNEMSAYLRENNYYILEKFDRFSLEEIINKVIGDIHCSV